MNKYLSILAVALLAAILIIGCDKPSAGTGKNSGANASQDNAALPAGLFLAKAPDNVKELTAVRLSAKDGETVTMRARVGGRKDVFSADRAVMTVADATVVVCDKKPEDQCSTPWDYCCHDPEELARIVASVQVLGPDNKPLHATLKNAGGLAPLKEVIIVGTVQKSADGKLLTINSTGLFVK